MNVVDGAVRRGDGGTDVVLGERRRGFELARASCCRKAGRAAAPTTSFARRSARRRCWSRVEPADGYVPVEAHIIEPLGAYDIVDLKVGSQFLRARTPSGFVRGPATTVWARIDPTQTHFFDNSTRRVAAASGSVS